MGGIEGEVALMWSVVCCRAEVQVRGWLSGFGVPAGGVSGKEGLVGGSTAVGPQAG